MNIRTEWLILAILFGYVFVSHNDSESEKQHGRKSIASNGRSAKAGHERRLDPVRGREESRDQQISNLYVGVVESL